MHSPERKFFARAPGHGFGHRRPRSMSNDPKLLRDLQDASDTQLIPVCIGFKASRSWALSRSSSSRSRSSCMTARSAQNVQQCKLRTLDLLDGVLSPALVQCPEANAQSVNFRP